MSHRTPRLSRTMRSLTVALMLALPGLGLADGIRVGDAYARAVPPGQENSAAFLTITNETAESRALISAESPAARAVELHTHSHEGGMMRMRRVDRIELPAGETVSLRPGGLHLMLIGLNADLAPGDQVGLDLGFDDGSHTQVEAPVRAIAPMKH